MKLKTSSLCLIALTTILWSSQVKSQEAITNDNYINPDVLGEVKNKGEGLIKRFGKKTAAEGVKKVAIEGAKKVAPAVALSAVVRPKKTASMVVAGTAVVAGGAIAGAWLYSTTIPAAVKRLAKDPTDFKMYWDNLDDDYEKKLEFAQKTWDYYYETIGEEQKKYEKLLKLLGYNISKINLETPILINNKSKIEQDDLEKTNEFEIAMAELATLIEPLDKKYEPQCRGNLGQQTRDKLLLPPIEFRKLSLIKKNTKTLSFLNVDSYSELDSEEKYLENDHIPSYKALEKFFNTQNKGVKFNAGSLRSNSTTISLPYFLHRNNRTWGKGNGKISTLDKYDLKIATLLDFATLITMKKIDKGNWETNKIDYNELLNSLIIVYERNAQLCLYY